MTDRLINWMSVWLTDWPTDWLTEQPTDRTTDRPTDWVTAWQTDRLTEWLVDWFIDWLIDRSIDWLIDWLVVYKGKYTQRVDYLWNTTLENELKLTLRYGINYISAHLPQYISLTFLLNSHVPPFDWLVLWLVLVDPHYQGHEIHSE